MAGGGGGLGKPERAKRGKHSKRKKKKRIGFHLDMTPLVDITFLLLTFFMFTTTMLKPQIMEMRIPPERYEKVEVRESELFSIMLMPWYAGMARPDNLPEEVPLNKLRALAEQQNLKPNVRNRLITVLKISDQAKYEKVVQILDELNLAEINITDQLSKDLDADGQPVKRQRKFTIAPLSETDDDFKLIQGVK